MKNKNQIPPAENIGVVSQSWHIRLLLSLLVPRPNDNELKNSWDRGSHLSPSPEIVSSVSLRTVFSSVVDQIDSLSKGD